jgi:hypothetical protein
MRLFAGLVFWLGTRARACLPQARVRRFI